MVDISSCKWGWGRSRRQTGAVAEDIRNTLRISPKQESPSEFFAGNRAAFFVRKIGAQIDKYRASGISNTI